MAKIQDLAREIAAELEAHRAEITAAKTQLGAIQQTHNDVLEAVGRSQSDLKEARDAVARARLDSQQYLQEAQQRAGVIIGEADKMSREASAELAAAEEQAKAIRKAAHDEAAKIVSSIANKKAELQEAVNELGRVKSQHDELRRQARQFADGC